ncbi:stress-related protein-like isoform X2 [Panicum virgatum]|uniref:stress-related protein-like isoform X2 n=1 Tax=Panicum virgatum TaxID=38727 RepID=UPI0019D63E74|nr:stress-related protein-like isoform X2 [Panicum virgatum]
MAEQPNPQPQVEEKEVVVEQQQQEPKRAPKLRYLDFVHVAAAQAVVCLAGLYGLAKSHAGPLRPGVDAVESAVKGVVGPVYDRFHSVPLDVLAFVDRKVDDTVHELDKHLPGALKAASAQAYAVARGIPEVARELAAEAQQSGVKGAAKDVYGRVEPVARDLYVRYEPAAEHLAVSTWRSLNGLPVFPQVAQIVVPTAAYWAEKYNKVIAAAANQGYTGAKYLPAIPTERIAKVFSSSTPDSEPLAETQ